MFDTNHTIEILTNVIGCMYCGIIVAKKEGNFLVWNNKASEVLGKKEADIPIEKWSEFYGCYNSETGKLLDYTDLPLYRAMQGEEVENYVLLIKNEIVKETWINCNAKPLLQHGEIVGGVVVFQDISREKEIERQLKILSKKMEILSEKQSTMIDSWKK